MGIEADARSACVRYRNNIARLRPVEHPIERNRSDIVRLMSAEHPFEREGDDIVRLREVEQSFERQRSDIMGLRQVEQSFERKRSGIVGLRPVEHPCERDRNDIVRLKRARSLAARVIGGDAFERLGQQAVTREPSSLPFAKRRAFDVSAVGDHSLWKR